MSKIIGPFKLKDLYAIKHALEDRIKEPGRSSKDIEHEKRIVDKLVDKINKYQKTEAHYGKSCDM